MHPVRVGSIGQRLGVMPEDLDQLAAVLDQADLERATDVEMLDALGDDELDYLAAVGDLADPVTDGIEGECV